ncbi:hypothetical protein GGH91_003229, partial [Coemansia sp. RSA 2671]
RGLSIRAQNTDGEATTKKTFSEIALERMRKRREEEDGANTRGRRYKARGRGSGNMNDSNSHAIGSARWRQKTRADRARGTGKARRTGQKVFGDGSTGRASSSLVADASAARMTDQKVDEGWSTGETSSTLVADASKARRRGKRVARDMPTDEASDDESAVDGRKKRRADDSDADFDSDDCAFANKVCRTASREYVGEPLDIPYDRGDYVPDDPRYTGSLSWEEMAIIRAETETGLDINPRVVFLDGPPKPLRVKLDPASVEMGRLHLIDYAGCPDYVRQSIFEGRFISGSDTDELLEYDRHSDPPNSPVLGAADSPMPPVYNPDERPRSPAYDPNKRLETPVHTRSGTDEYSYDYDNWESNLYKEDYHDSVSNYSSVSNRNPGWSTGEGSAALAIAMSGGFSSNDALAPSTDAQSGMRASASMWGIPLGTHASQEPRSPSHSSSYSRNHGKAPETDVELDDEQPLPPTSHERSRDLVTSRTERLQ